LCQPCGVQRREHIFECIHAYEYCCNTLLQQYSDTVAIPYEYCCNTQLQQYCIRILWQYLRAFIERNKHPLANGTSQPRPPPPPHINCRKASYIHIARDDLQRRDLFKPAQYLRSHLDPLPLLRLRTQATSYIPSHLHLANDHTYTPYYQRYCPSCLPIQIVYTEQNFRDFSVAKVFF